MKTRYNGRYIIVETEDDLYDFDQLRCVCGHLAKDHKHNYLVGSSNTIEIGACKKSGHCGQFKITGKIEASIYHYA